MAWSSAIYGCSGRRVTREERALFRDVRPWGFILFARNLVEPGQIRGRIEELREAADDEAAMVFVDQEGGRVQRLRPPLARQRRPADSFGVLWSRDPEAAREAVFLNHRLIAEELSALGFDADCAPCLDVRRAETHAAIGDRAFSDDPEVVGELGRAAVAGLLAGGVAPVIKHVTGHGRATSDSHLALPVVQADLELLEATDFMPFRMCADAPMGMTAHVVFEAADPTAPATVSPCVVQEVIRDHIGFEGVLMTDDLSMKALKGSFQDRTARALDAGCDLVLHCNGEMAEMKAIASKAPELQGRCLERAEAARAAARKAEPFEADVAEARLAELDLGGTLAA